MLSPEAEFPGERMWEQIAQKNRQQQQDVDADGRDSERSELFSAVLGVTPDPTTSCAETNAGVAASMHNARGVARIFFREAMVPSSFFEIQSVDLGVSAAQDSIKNSTRGI